MKFRHEYKHIITPSDLVTLRMRLQAVTAPDKNGVNGTPKYFIRSLYFDSPGDKALREKITGAQKREKFRIRYYNNDTSFIRLEKKSKINSLCNKQSARISRDEVSAILEGRTEWMINDSRELIRELYRKMQTQGLRPKTVVDYTREAYTYLPGNCRLTLDYSIRTGIAETDMFSPDFVTVPAGDSTIILEVKWDEFLPQIIRDTVTVRGVRPTAFSKYAACRIYG
ncbi:MAG: polyphosphate polymerase domain-containing protein [Clostridia bacterium]|nr:polyphosphate polymerase domain-containing protein [Clostridia bacterium]